METKNELTGEDRETLRKKRNEYAKRAIETAVETDGRKNGIYIEYHDHLSCDGFHALVKESGTVRIENDHITMMDDSDYYHSKGLRSVINGLRKEHPTYDLVWIDCGWFTFPKTYLFDRAVPSGIKDAWPDIRTLHVPKDTE